MIRVLVVDDSSFMRTSLTYLLKTDKSIDVIGTAGNGREAIEKVIVFESLFAIVIEGKVAAIGEEVRALLLMIPSVKSVDVLVGSIKKAMP